LVNPISAVAFPNPFADELNISINLNNTSYVEIEIMDVAGRIISDENEGENFSGKNIFHLEGISELNAGMYFVQVITNGESVVMPVLKN
jgi:hypothetical protein